MNSSDSPDSKSGSPQDALGKLLYGLLFVAVLPGALFLWAILASPNLKLPVVQSKWPGFVFAIFGISVLFWGMLSIIMIGKGLPMNAYPPREFVTSGIYAILPHPIYFGFCSLCAGVSILLESPAGLWLITPSVILGCIALVQGYEKDDLKTRFPNGHLRPWLSLPENKSTQPSLLQRLSVYPYLFLTWGILYEVVCIIGIPRDAFQAYLGFESSFPVVQWTEFIYLSAFPFALLVPLVTGKSSDLRHFVMSGLIGIFLISVCYLALPLISPPRAFEPSGISGSLLLMERRSDTIGASFPSFHVFWALLSASSFSRRFPKLRLLWWFWALAIGISCITTGMHAIVDILAAPLFALLSWNYSKVWAYLRSATEKIANSWREKQIGKVRIINHGSYAGVAAFSGIIVAGCLLPSSYWIIMLVFTACVLVGAGLWAQFVEGSPNLLRPFGWYGGVIGALCGALLAVGAGKDPWLLLGAFTIAGPWVQAIGRLRCLVQGCCHGKASSAEIGISYTHPRSRVCRLSDLGGRPVHPTPLYSILINAFLALFLLRLWMLKFPVPLIMGEYLILSGLGRFVEEAYRGEPQTLVRYGLRLYQWMAILSVVSGAVLTTVKGLIPPDPHLGFQAIPAALLSGLVTWFLLGVDFPESSYRFSRLT